MRRTRNPGSATKDAGKVGATGNGAPPAAEIMSVDDLVARYDDEWILLRITEWDEDGWPSHGEVLAHSPDHDYIWDVTGNRPPDPATGEQHYIFQAHPTVRTGAAMMEALKTTADLLEVPALGLCERVLDVAYCPGFGSGWISGSVASASSRHWALVATPWIRACASLHGSG